MCASRLQWSVMSIQVCLSALIGMVKAALETCSGGTALGTNRQCSDAERCDRTLLGRSWGQRHPGLRNQRLFCRYRGSDRAHGPLAIGCAHGKSPTTDLDFLCANELHNGPGPGRVQSGSGKSGPIWSDPGIHGPGNPEASSHSMRERARSDEEHVQRKARQPRWPRAWSSARSGRSSWSTSRNGGRAAGRRPKSPFNCRLPAKGYGSTLHG